jgi:L-rhamnose-H+ transport protein
MQDSLLVGLSLVLAGGLFQGSFMLPSKAMRGWAWENYWLIFAATAYLTCPWILAIVTIPRLSEVYSGVTPASLAAVIIHGAAWGVGAVTFGLGVDAVGLALGFAVILGIAATAGTLIPLIVNPPRDFSSTQALLIGASLTLMLIGVAVCSFAGKWKEAQSKRGASRSYRRGILICVVSGFLSACGNLGFNFGADITRRAQSLGVPDHLAVNALWTLLTFPLFLCNAGYAIYLLRRNGTGDRFSSAESRRCVLLAISMGIMWMAGFAFYGAGARKLGDLGPSLGWAILMSTMVLVANAQGIATGEWKDAPPGAKRRLFAGIILLVAAIGGLGYANG